MTNLTNFVKCTTQYKRDGRHHVDCDLGLWSVEGTRLIDVTTEAVHTFNQHESNGKYKSIIGGKSLNGLLKQALNKDDSNG